MKILILASWYPDGNDRTNGIFVKEQAKALSDSGTEVRVFYPFDKSLENSSLKKSAEDGLLTYRCNTDYMKNSKLSRINSAMQTIRKLNAIRKEFDFDILHCHVCYFAGMIGYIYKKLYGKRYLITEHMSYVASYARKKYDYMLFKGAYSSAERVICVSEYLSNSLRELGFNFREQIIGNVVDTGSFSKTAAKCFDDSFVNILFAGSMGNDEVKGISYLLKAFARLSELEHIYRLHIIGDGPKRKEYEELAALLGISDYCSFYGKLNKASVAGLMQSCSFFVLPSKYETFGTVIIEALSCGKPVVTTDTGAQKEIINDKRLGLIVKAQDVDSLFDGLKYMSQNYRNYDSSLLRERAMDYSYENIAGKLNEMYKNIWTGNDGVA